MKIAVPPSMSRRPRDPDRPDFAVPWFVAWIDADASPVVEGRGKPEYRVIDDGKIVAAVKKNLCWLCGEKLGAQKCFVVGPMCAINQISAEPPSHRECAEYAVQVCPFLTQPKMVRNDKNLPEHEGMAGNAILRNPGCCLIWQTTGYQPFHPHPKDAGVLFRFGAPVCVTWWRCGKPATRAEVLASIDSGLPALLEGAWNDPQSGAVQELMRRYAKACELLPKE